MQRQAYIKRRNTSSLLLRRVRLWVKRWFLCRGGAGSGGSTAAAAADADSDELLTYVHPRLFVQLQLASSKNRLFQLLRVSAGCVREGETAGRE